MQRVFRVIHDNSLSILFFTLFVVCFVGQSFAGWRVENETLAAHGRAGVGFGSYLLTGAYLEGLASNWQAAVLQLASLILFSKFLFQRGAPHSRNPDEPEGQRRAKKQQARKDPWWRRNSLSAAFAGIFALTLALHVIGGAHAYNESRQLLGQPPLRVSAFLYSAQFWSTTLQTWQAEYLVIGLYVVMSIFLRQEDSPESKPVESSDQQTGEPNK